MPRQVLTFLFIFLLVMFMMKACAPNETLPAAVVTESAPATEEVAYTLKNGVVLARGPEITGTQIAERMP